MKTLAKSAVFSPLLQKTFKPCGKFSRVWTKNNCLGNFEKILKNFDEHSMENLIFLYFLGNFVA